MARKEDNMRRLIPVILCFVLFLIVVAPAISASEDQMKVSLVNKSGVSVTVEVARTSHINAELNYISGIGTESRLILRQAVDTFLAIPLRIVREIQMKGKEHLVTLNNKLQFKGYLEGSIQDASSKKYELGAVTKLSVISLPSAASNGEESEQEAAYQLRITRPIAATYRISSPEFVFRYWSGAAYLVGGQFYATSTSKFYMKVDGEDISADLPDFDEITLSGKVTDAGEMTMIKAKSKAGMATTGELLLAVSDRAGLHPAQPGWVFVADLKDTGGVQIVLRRPNCVMQEL